MTPPLAALSILGLVFATSPVAGAYAAELKVLAGGSMTASLNEIKPQFESATGHKLTLHFNSTPNLIKQVTSDAAFDLGGRPRRRLQGRRREGAGAHRGRLPTSRAWATASRCARALPSPTSARPKR